MRLFHISDLHIGKQLRYYNLAGNQRAVLKQIVERAEEYRPDVILICGDIFDKSSPSGEAYTIFDEFLNDLAGLNPRIPVLMIAGNHDSPQRLAYARTFLERNQIYLSVLPPQGHKEHIKKVTLADEWGSVNFYLLPFLKPGYVRHLFEEGRITDYQSAVEAILARDGLDRELPGRNVLLSHQFYVNGGRQPELCDSEQRGIQVGGIDSVDVSLVERFDYVALGHIHGPQKVKNSHIRYCGTPLKYSVSEEHHEKSITMVTLKEKGTAPEIETIPLIPIQEVRRERGLLSEILKRATPENCHDFLSVTITDEKEPYHPMEQLEEKYDFLLELKVDNQRTRALSEFSGTEEEIRSPMEVFAAFYQEMRGQPMSPEEEAWMEKLLNTEEVVEK